MNPPKTKAEAEKMRYGPTDMPYQQGKCAYPIFWHNVREPFQCYRSPGHGPDKLFCWQHAKLLEKKTA